jgi:hypothetical protein
LFSSFTTPQFAQWLTLLSANLMLSQKP